MSTVVHLCPVALHVCSLKAASSALLWCYELASYRAWRSCLHGSQSQHVWGCNIRSADACIRRFVTSALQIATQDTER